MTYQLERVRLINVHNFVDETVALRGGGHLFLLGDNGSGKTTVLDAIHDVLAGGELEWNAAARLGGRRDEGRSLQGVVLRFDAERGVRRGGGAIAQKDLVDILNIALRDSILPTELIVTKNSKSTPWTNAPFIVVRADKEKKLNRLLNPPANNHVWISDYEEIFELAIPFGLVPLKITRKKNRLTLDYKTVKYPSKDGANTCHTGRLIADREGDMWIIVDSKVKETKCETDTYGLKK